MQHIILAGDSVFKNDKFVQADFSVADLLGVTIPQQTKISLVANENCTIQDLKQQLCALPGSTSHVFLSCGKCLLHEFASRLQKDISNYGNFLDQLATLKNDYALHYRSLIHLAKDATSHIVSCSLIEDRSIKSPLSILLHSIINEIIFHESAMARISIIDLAKLFNEEIDYCRDLPSQVSEYGGRKLVLLLTQILQQCAPAPGRSIIF